MFLGAFVYVYVYVFASFHHLHFYLCMTKQDVLCYGKCQVCIQVSELPSEMLSGSWHDLKLVGAE